MSEQHQDSFFPPLRGYEHVGISDPESPNFVPHPWSATHTTCLFASAFMRAEYTYAASHPVTRSITGEVTYVNAEEIRLKASLIQRERKTL